MQVSVSDPTSFHFPTWAMYLTGQVHSNCQHQAARSKKLIWCWNEGPGALSSQMDTRNLTLDKVTCLSSPESVPRRSSARNDCEGRCQSSFGTPSQGWRRASSWRGCRGGASPAAGFPTPGCAHQHTVGCSRQSSPALEQLHRKEPAGSLYWLQRQAWRWTRLNPARDSRVRQSPRSWGRLRWHQTLRCQKLPGREEARPRSQCRCQSGTCACQARSSSRLSRHLHSQASPVPAIIKHLLTDSYESKVV